MDICGSLCGSCSKSCNESKRHELAMCGKLTYIYLKNGNKIANTCSFHTRKTIVKTKKDILSMISSMHPVQKKEPEFVLSFPTY